MKNSRNVSKVIVGTLLIALTSGCAAIGRGGSRSASLPLPACPPEEVELTLGWLGPGFIPTNEGPLHAFAMAVQDRVRYEAWTDEWMSCAKARGIVIEEANR